MKRNVLVLVVTVTTLFVLVSFSWATCPEAPNDLGQCDTLHVVPWDNVAQGGFPRLVHVPLLVTHDSNTFYSGGWKQDSIAAMIIPLKWTHTNPAAYCSLPPSLNTNSFTDTATSVFRDFGGMQNRMLDLYELDGGWDTRVIDIVPLGHAWFSLIAGNARRKWYEGSRVLLATLTFLVSDTMTICIDTMSAPPAWHFWFARYDGYAYVPRHNIPVCFKVSTGHVAWLNFRGYPDIAVQETLSYYIEYGNEAYVQELTQCSLSVHIPPQVGYVSADPPGAVIDTTIFWEIGTIAPGTSGRITLDLTLNESVGTPDSTFQIHVIETGYEEVGSKKEGMKGAERFVKPVYKEVKQIWPVVDLEPDKDPYKTFGGGANSYEVWVYNRGVQISGQGGSLDESVFDPFNCLDSITASNGPFYRIIPWEWESQVWCFEDALINNRGNKLGGDALKIDVVTVYVKNEDRCAHKWVVNHLIVYGAHGEGVPEEELFHPWTWPNNWYHRLHWIWFPYDPNEMLVGPSDYVRPGGILTYTINFENEGSASAESIRISSWIDTNLVEQTLLFDDTVASYNGYTRMAIWDFPDINLQPDSSGYVSYRINVNDSLESGTEIKGNGMIYFDIMPGVPCSASVTVDALKPISQVDSVIGVALPDSYQVFWSGYDPTPGASGIGVYSIYFSKDGGPDSLWFADTSWFEEDTLESSATFIAESGHNYCFYSKAQDRVGWVESRPTVPDACTIPFLRGDVNADWKINTVDVVYLINYLFIHGPAPNPVERADCNCDGIVNTTDVVYLINYLFINGPPPPC
jgi:hypothetical protein